MIKRFTLIGSVLLLTTLSACDGSTKSVEPSENQEETTTSPDDKSSGDLRLAYVNTDSLSARFELIKDMEDEIVAERMKMENQYQRLVQDLQKDYNDAQQGAAGLSEEALAILQQKLSQKEQQVMQQKSMMENQLMQFEQERTDMYLDKVQSFIADYAKAEGYDMIYGFNGLNNLLYIDKGYDLTDVVVDSLNAQYQVEKSAKDQAAK